VSRVLFRAFDGVSKKDVIEIVREGQRIQTHEFGCTGCTHWRHGKNARCGKWDAVPPAEVQAVGCDYWRYDDIPF
jgi:hypothetical protein